MIDLSNVFYYLRIEVDIDYNKKAISFWQSTYPKKMLGQYDMSNCKLAKTPISSRVANSLTLYKDEAKKNIVAWYQSAMRVFM